MKQGIALAALLATAAAAPGSRQAAYDAAQAAYDKGDWTTAAAGFAPLLPPADARALKPSEGVIATRLAVALDQLGRSEEAAVAARRGIAALPDGGASALADGWAVIGDRARIALATDEAVDAYGKALRYATAANYDAQRVAASEGLSIVLATVDPARAAAPVDALLAERALLGRLAKTNLADLWEVRARIALNAGDLPDAQRWVDRALSATGGLTPSANQLQLAIRGDAAIIAQLRHDGDAARRYLTYTGAGHLDTVGWITAFNGSLPVCGGEGDLRAEDSAVVELAVADDGHVLAATPVYASRAGDVGATFAHAAQGWHWDPSSLVGVKPFWRAALRLEMRCDARPDPQALGKPIWRAAWGWLASQGVPDADHERFYAFDDPGLTRDDLSAVPALLAVAGNRRADAALPARLYHILDRYDAPPALRASAIVSVATNDARGGTFRETARRAAAAYAVAVPPFAARYPDTASLAWLRLEWAIALERSGDFATALPLLGQVLATPERALDHDDPIRQVATLHVALVRTRTGDAGGAAADLRAAGLDAAQCALVDTRPVPTNLSIVSSQFPAEALRWHFEGFARIAYDIGADGRVAKVRTVLAYPPFIFGPGTEKAANGFRYATPTLDGRPVGCQGETQTVNYRIPR